MNKEIIVKIVRIYGRDIIYPVCETAKRLALLSGCKTLTKSNIGLIKGLGYTIKVEEQKL